VSVALSCPSCLGPSSLTAHAVIAPWIQELCASTITGETELRSCNSCGLGFFSHRYESDEVDALYGNYRQEIFFETRHKWEPWYNRDVNNAFTDSESSQEQIGVRRSFTARCLERSGRNLSDMHGCVDFGGDRGQFIPREINPPHFVVEHNSATKATIGPVTFVDDISSISTKVDLVMNCYVLEHLSDLSDVLSEMRSLLSSSGLIHLEVPLDRFRCSRFHKTSLYSRYIRWLSRHRRSFIAVDLISGVFRQYLSRIPWFGVVKQSEHVNYFDQKSLRTFIETRGGRVLFTSEPDLKYRVGRIRQGRLACIVN
jgi:hypothetical protein